MPSSAIGGAMLPHAPQFFTIPETEDSATVERVKEVAHEIRIRLKALKPDLWIHLCRGPRRAVLSRCCACLHCACRRQRLRQFRRAAVSLAGAGRNRLRDRAETVPPGFRPRLHQRGQDRLRDRYPADPSRSRRPGIADIGLRLPAAAADDRAPLHHSARRWRTSSRAWACAPWRW